LLFAFFLPESNITSLAFTSSWGEKATPSGANMNDFSMLKLCLSLAFGV
jgi:hypothetical protein